MREEMQAAIDARDCDLFAGSSQPKAGVPLHPESIEDGLALAGAQRLLAERLRADAIADLDAWIEAAIDAGMPIAQIARHASISRETIYARRR